MKQTTLAAAAGTTQPHIARLENGRAAPSWELLDRLAAALATTASDLLTDRS